MISDFPYIEQMRKRLWTGREVGQAAIMIGSGFSRNAEPSLPSAPPFPLWTDLSERLQEELYGSSKKNGDSSRDFTPNALRVATEYEVVFGRVALNEMIVRAIPDRDYFPSYLHELMLSLPWSDVFTTNYDTLLERTLPSVHDRRYHVVLTPSDLPGSMKPRIIKLHGSLPSPLIVTEEDFRTYPTDFAPFVNTVQQAIMENALCLIGFSGEDPNFLYWTGWVRDNLGKSTPPIYLCSLTEVSLAQRGVLEKRNVFPIDMSAVISATLFPDPVLRHAKTLEWFGLTLMAGEPPVRRGWPKIARSDYRVPSYGLPPIPTNNNQVSELGNASRGDYRKELTVDELSDLFLRWKEQRSSYPNWEVLPDDNREMLWRYTEHWIGPVLNSINNLPVPENLLLLSELNWRLEKSLVPIAERWREKYQSVIDAFNPFPGLVIDSTPTVRPDVSQYKELDWQAISNNWIELRFAIVREARERLDEARFKHLIEELNEVVKQKPDWQARWYYEQALFWLFAINHEKARSVLNGWAQVSAAPFWKVKRSAVLAEIGELKEAERIAEEALTSIRSRLYPYPDDYTLMSQEGWAMILLKSLKDNPFGERTEAVARYRDRWEQLARYGCNPWPDIETLQLIVGALNPAPHRARRQTSGFHPGWGPSSQRVTSEADSREIRLSLSFLRMFEDGALPFRTNAVSFFAQAVVNGAKCIATSNPEWSLSAMLRTSSEDEIKGWFDYIQIATLPQSKVNYLYNLFLTSFTQAAENLQPLRRSQMGDTAQRHARLYAELLSRLCIRLSPEQLQQVFDLTRSVYLQPIFRENLWYHECVSALFEGLLENLPNSEVLTKMPLLLSLPLPSENGFEVAEAQKWPEPFLRLGWPYNTTLGSDFDRSEWTAPISNLLRIVKDGTEEARTRAVSRLVSLVNIDALTDQELTLFGSALWSRMDQAKGLPRETDLHDFGFLHLPSPDLKNVQNHFRRNLLARDFRRVVRREKTPDGKETKSVSIGGGPDLFIKDWLGATAFPPRDGSNERWHYLEWSPGEVNQLLKKASIWWDEEKADLNPLTAGDPFFSDSLRGHFDELIKLFAHVILPRIDRQDATVVHRAYRLLQEMEESDLQVQPALPGLLFLAPARREEIASNLLAALHSSRENVVDASVQGIYHWFLYSAKSSLVAAPSYLLDELLHLIVLRRRPGLDTALRAVINSLKYFPKLFGDEQFDKLSLALIDLEADTRFGPEGSIRADGQFEIESFERPWYRKLSAELAFCLTIELTSRKKEISQILHNWKVVAQTSELPLVRNVWLEAPLMSVPQDAASAKSSS